MVLFALAQPCIIGLAHTALQSFWPMLRAALSRIKSNPCQSTTSPRSLFRKLFAHLDGGNPGTIKFSFRAYRRPSAGVLGILLELESTHSETFQHKVRKASRAALASVPAAEGLFQLDRTRGADHLEEPLVGGWPKVHDIHWRCSHAHRERRSGAPSHHRRRLQLRRQSGQSTVVPSASVPKCCCALPSAAK